MSLKSARIIYGTGQKNKNRCVVLHNIDLAKRAVREIGAQDPVGRDADPGLESCVRPVPGGTHRRGFRAAGHGGLHAAGPGRRPTAAGQAGDDVAERAHDVAGQVQDRLEQVLRVGAAKDPAEPRAGDVDGRRRRVQGLWRRGKRLPGRVAALARLSQGILYVLLQPFNDV